MSEPAQLAFDCDFPFCAKSLSEAPDFPDGSPNDGSTMLRLTTQQMAEFWWMAKNWKLTDFSSAASVTVFADATPASHDGDLALSGSDPGAPTTAAVNRISLLVQPTLPARVSPNDGNPTDLPALSGTTTSDSYTSSYSLNCGWGWSALYRDYSVPMGDFFMVPNFSAGWQSSGYASEEAAPIDSSNYLAEYWGGSLTTLVSFSPSETPLSEDAVVWALQNVSQLGEGDESFGWPEWSYLVDAPVSIVNENNVGTFSIALLGGTEVSCPINLSITSEINVGLRVKDLSIPLGWDPPTISTRACSAAMESTENW